MTERAGRRTYADQVDERGPLDEWRKVRLEIDPPVATITLNDPESLNAFSIRLTGELRKALAEADADRRVRAIVLTGSGKAFTAGGDLRQMEQAETGPIELYEFIRREFGGVVQAIAATDKPVIAAVNGHAMGVGFFTALACDMIVASERAKFGTAYIHLGLTPLGVSQILATLVGYHKAYELCALGEVLTASEGAGLGFVNRVVAPESLMEEAGALARRLADGPPRALGFTKMLLNRAIRGGLDEHLQIGESIQPLCLDSDDHREALAAFAEKRKPVYRGR
ncbi:enoyl-CoA hydratase/isomerase family protein [Minwuia thermotolerans]|nr:enoyl-CoA hydratase-related protein [Minwuia thermotolerans]